MNEISELFTESELLDPDLVVAWKDNPFVFPIDYSLFFQGRGVYENNRRTAGNSK